jgi:hypothetical protein
LILGSIQSTIEVHVCGIFEDGNIEASVLRPVFLPFFFPLLGFRRGEDGWTLGSINSLAELLLFQSPRAAERNGGSRARAGRACRNTPAA